MIFLLTIVITCSNAWSKSFGTLIFVECDNNLCLLQVLLLQTLHESLISNFVIKLLFIILNLTNKLSMHLIS